MGIGMSDGETERRREWENGENQKSVVGNQKSESKKSEMGTRAINHSPVKNRPAFV